MESLVHAAVAELQKLVENSSTFLELRAEEELPLPAKVSSESREKTVRSRAAVELDPGTRARHWLYSFILTLSICKFREEQIKQPQHII